MNRFKFTLSIKNIVLFCSLAGWFTNADAQDLTNIKFTATEDTAWTNLFVREDGWFGGDGIYSIPLNGVEYGKPEAKKTLFIFSDSMIGKIKDSKMKPGARMIHNSVAVLKGVKPVKENISFFWKNDAKDSAETVFVPKTPLTGPKDYYWLGDGFVNQEQNDAIYIFGYRVKQVGDGAFGFSEVGNTLIKISQKEQAPFKNFEQKDTPFYLSESKTEKEMGSFGAGIFVNTAKAGAPNPDGYIYIYGVKGMAKKLLVARVKPKEFDDYSKWNFWDGAIWNADITKAETVTDQVSNELSLSALPDGRYALVFQQSGLSRTVGMRLGKTPVGPFGPIIKLWDCSDALKEKSYFPYNAKAHPSLSEKGELLISYNVNSFEFFKDLDKDPQLYRPRFIKIKFN
ncbi:DUF4185 domain-containing protein [Pedobacter foliorum]|uniref:DUF4185 domain-containing protein n=1 Tax=Pedobacter foliorum TaxID=2739058 RepID=UPI001565D323|nr:DUF4185 domain-containing protein [Pedobacter foliorum]NRF41562.1 DUF4185 domain-containing protein [Pedobacter foliorum]